MPRRRNPVSDYARKVLAGRIVAGPWVRKACQRHLDDMRAGRKRGLRWDLDAALRAIGFFSEILCLPDIDWIDPATGLSAPQPFRLEPWQAFIVGSLFGWKNADGMRRYRTAYIEVGKGNGKSPMAAGLGVLGMVGDGEQAAEVYSAATTRDQAKIVWGDARKMVRRAPSLKPLVEVGVNNLAFERTFSFFRPVSSDASTLDGYRPHFVLVDEIHEHPNDEVINKMRAGFKRRTQPLMFEITNSGYDRESVCWQHHEYSEKVLSGVLENDDWFAYVCALDEDDDPLEDEACWVKANPNLGVSVPVKYLREQVTEARDIPSKRNIVLRLNFCVWTQQHTRWIPMDVWDRNAGDPVTETALSGRTCYSGLDLASTTDIAALVHLFPEDDGFVVLPRFWVPGDMVETRARRDGVAYDVWVREGWITATPGNVIDFKAIRAQMVKDARTFGLRHCGFDPWNATQLATQLMEDDGIPMVQVRQGFVSMNEPMKLVEKLLLAGKLRHGGNPVLRWMADNVAAKTDPAGNIKPDKQKSTERIDGIVALLDAISMTLTQAEHRSVYEERGLLVFG